MLRSSASAVELPSLVPGHGSKNNGRSTRQRSALALDAMPHLETVASAPSLSLLSRSCEEVRNGVERVVARLTERPNVGPLLLLNDAEHAASVLKAISPERRHRRGQPPPRLLSQPALKSARLNRLADRSTVLSDIADQLGGFHMHSGSLLDDGEAAPAPEVATAGGQHSSSGSLGIAPRAHFNVGEHTPAALTHTGLPPHRGSSMCALSHLCMPACSRPSDDW